MGGDSLRRGAFPVYSRYFTGGYSRRCQHACHPYRHPYARQLFLLVL